MMTSLICALLLSGAPAQNGELKVTNARPTYGYLGAARPKSGILPGDIAYFAFDVKGLQQDDKGRVAYTLEVEVLNGKGERAYHLGPINSVSQNFLGGQSMPCAAHLEVPKDAAPGLYKMIVKITDRKSKNSAVFTATGKVLPAAFGLVRVGTFADAETKAPRTPVGAVGETLYLNFSLIGFSRGEDGKEPDVALSLDIKDADGKSTLPEPRTGAVNKGVTPEQELVPMTLGFSLNRAGRFTLELQATDKLSGKTSKVSLPVHVTAAP